MIDSNGFLKEASSHYQLLLTRTVVEVSNIASVYGKNSEFIKFIEDFSNKMLKASIGIAPQNLNDLYAYPAIGDVSPDIKFTWFNPLERQDKGLTVIEGNAENDLKQFPNLSFDYVILSQTLQAFLDPENVINELLRVGKKAIVTIPNFGFWKVRISLLFKGTMPVTNNLPNEWYNTPNLHMCTIKDFVNYCKKRNIKINILNLNIQNLFSELGIFIIEK